MQYSEIEALMPHRWPMLLVDAITRLDEWSYVEGIKNVTASELCFSGVRSEGRVDQFAYPASLIIESFGQTGGVLISKKRAMEGISKDVVVLLVGLMGFRFTGQIVLPGDTMIHCVHTDKITDDFAILSGKVSVRERLIAEAEGIIVAYRHSVEGGGYR